MTRMRKLIVVLLSLFVISGIQSAVFAGQQNPDYPAVNHEHQFDDIGIDALYRALDGTGPQIYRDIRVHSETGEVTIYSVPIQDSDLEYLISVMEGTRIQPLSMPFPVTQIRDSDLSHEDSIVIILLSDGFEPEEKGSWPNPEPGTVLYHADNAMTTMANTHPFGLFEDLFTVYVIHTYGTNHRTGIGYLGAVNEDALGFRDIRPGGFTVLLQRVFGLADMIVHPADQTMIQIIVNADNGGGWADINTLYHPDYRFGMGIAATSVQRMVPGNTRWHGVFLHEFGHSFGGLTDERTTGVINMAEWFANSTLASDTDVKWIHWAGHRGVSPTPRRLPNGWAVPGYDCIMGTALVPNFCGVCTAELIRRLAFVSGETFIGRSPVTYNPLPNTPIITLPQGTTRILDSAFHGNTSLNTITIPASVTTIGDFAFIGATGLETIINHSTIPQQINYTTFAGVDRANVYLHVPAGTEQAYIDAGWTGFRGMPEPIPPLPIQNNRVSVGNSGYSFIIMPDNSLWGWGSNWSGQLGDGTTTDRHTPIWIMDDVVSVSAGNSHTMVIRVDGSLWGWGDNGLGQLGDGTSIRRSTPIWIMDDVVAVATGSQHTMALRADGSLWGWGSNSVGQIGDGSPANFRLIPVRIMDDVVAVATGFQHTMAITTDSNLWGWGYNRFGLVGDGTSTHHHRPVKIMDNVTSVSAGDSHTMAIRADGSLWGWGRNMNGLLGDGTTIGRNAPVWIMDDVVEVAAGIVHTIAVKTDGCLWGWGENWAGQLGDGTTINRHSPVLIKCHAPAPPTVVNNRISAGNRHSFVIMPDNSLWGWGDNLWGQVGDGTRTDRHIPVWIMDDVVAVTAGGLQTMAIRTDGSLWGWGWNQSGELGDGTTNDHLAPVWIMDDVVAVAGVGSHSHTMAIRTDGSLWGWGNIMVEQSGNGIVVNHPTPVWIMDDVAEVATIGGHIMVIKTDGSLWGWGNNWWGRLGDGTTTDRYAPVWIMDDVSAVSAGFGHTVAIRTDGSLWGWGQGWMGQLGDGTEENHYTPIWIMDDVVKVSAGNRHTMAITADCDLWGWGWGQLGDGTTMARLAPVWIMDDVVAVSAGSGHSSHTMAIRADGSLWSWGWNSNGQVGDGTTTHRVSPVLIKGN